MQSHGMPPCEHVPGQQPPIHSLGARSWCTPKHTLLETCQCVTTRCGTGPVIFTQLLVALNDRGMYERAWKLFDHMRINHCEPDEVAFTAMISGKCVCVRVEAMWRVPLACSWVCFLLSIAQATPTKGDTTTACVCTAPVCPFWTTRVIVARGQ
jgi:pentatricopeptide repeat protein